MTRVEKLTEILSCEEAVLDPDDAESLACVIEAELLKWEADV